MCGLPSVMAPLLSPTERECAWHAAPGMEEHAAFCRTYDGYGAFCSCHEPPWSPRPASPVRVVGLCHTCVSD